MSTPKPTHRAVFEGSDLIALRLRSARKPMVLDLLEIPPEEIDVEPILLEPVALLEGDVIPIEPLIVPLEDILPLEDEPAAPPPLAPPLPQPSTGPTETPGALPLFGVGWVDMGPASKR